MIRETVIPILWLWLAMAIPGAAVGLQVVINR